MGMSAKDGMHRDRLGSERGNSCVRTTDATTHVRAGSGGEETGDESRAVSMAMDLHLLAGLADRLEDRLLLLLLRFHGADVDVAVVQGGRRAGTGVCYQHVVGTV